MAREGDVVPAGRSPRDASRAQRTPVSAAGGRGKREASPLPGGPAPGLQKGAQAGATAVARLAYPFRGQPKSRDSPQV